MKGNYLIVKGSGGAGLGDRIRSLIVAVIYAKLSNRILCVDWKDTAYGCGNMNIFPELFELRGIPNIKKIPEVGTIRPVAWKNRLHLSFDEIRALDGAKSDGSDWNRQEAIDRYSFDLSLLDYSEEALVMWDFDQIDKVVPYAHEIFPDLNDSDLLHIQSHLLQKHLSLKNDISKIAKGFIERYFKENLIVGVHVRHTRESQKARETPPLWQYFDTVRKFSEGSNDIRIFLATDNVSVLQHFIKTFGKEKVLYINKWFPEPGTSIHKCPSCPDPLQAAKDSLVDAYLLSKCNKMIVIHNSSFSYLARMWFNSTMNNVIVMFPKVPLMKRLLKKISSMNKYLFRTF